MMSENNNISVEEAHSALKSIDNANNLAHTFNRAPFWIRAITSLLIAALTIAGAWSSGSGFWTIVTIAIVAINSVIIVTYYLLLRRKGVKLRLNAKNRTEHMVNFIIGLITALLFIFSIEMYQSGYSWAVYLAAIGNFIVTFYFFTKYAVSGAKIASGGKQ